MIVLLFRVNCINIVFSLSHINLSVDKKIIDMDVWYVDILAVDMICSQLTSIILRRNGTWKIHHIRRT